MGGRRKVDPPARALVAIDDGSAVGGVLALAVAAAHDGTARELEDGIDRLITAEPADTDAALASAGDRVIAALFAHGWQPADVIRATDAAHQGQPAAMIRRRMATYPAERVDALWTAQLAALPGDPPSASRHDMIRSVVEVLARLNHLPRLPLLVPPPGVARAAPVRHADGRMLARIRALLAKAESTSFPDEAESYSAKAQQLMARHRIDHALVAGEVRNPEEPVGVRVTVAAPYADAKAMLLHVVAEANGCRAVWSAEHGFSTVFGYADEIEAVEILYTSLLVQGSAAMVREGSARHDSPARTKTFRQSFMHAYAIHIGDRLRAEARRAEAAAGSDDRLLPVLARRDQAVNDQVERVFPGTESRGRSIRIDSEPGWQRGRTFARAARLDG